VVVVPVSCPASAVGGSSRETVLVRTADTKLLHFLRLLSLARGVNRRLSLSTGPEHGPALGLRAWGRRNRADRRREWRPNLINRGL
jgi:hypothetical protein